MKIEVVLSKTNVILYLPNVSMKFTVKFVLLTFLSMENISLWYNFLSVQSKSILKNIKFVSWFTISIFFCLSWLWVFIWKFRKFIWKSHMGAKFKYYFLQIQKPLNDTTLKVRNILVFLKWTFYLHAKLLEVKLWQSGTNIWNQHELK